MLRAAQLGIASGEIWSTELKGPSIHCVAASGSLSLHPDSSTPWLCDLKQVLTLSVPVFPHL